MDVFGGSRVRQRGIRGARGIRGRDGTMSDLCTWMPQTLLLGLQTLDEIACYLLTDPKKDLVISKDRTIQKWISRNTLNALNLYAEKPSSTLSVVVEGRYAITLYENRYVHDDVPFLTNLTDTNGFLCVTFRVDGDGMETVLLSSYTNQDSPFREIRVTSTEIIINATGHSITGEIIQHACNEWTTLMLSYEAHAHLTSWSWTLNNDSHTAGSFTTTTAKDSMYCITLGSRFDATTHYFRGQIAGMEMYHGNNGATALPPNVLKLIVKNQMIPTSLYTPRTLSLYPSLPPVCLG